MLVSKKTKICVTPNAKPKICITPKANPQRESVGCVGSPGVGAGVDHVDFMLFVLISFALGIQREPSLQWNMGFTFWSEFNGSIELCTSVPTDNAI